MSPAGSGAMETQSTPAMVRHGRCGSPSTVAVTAAVRRCVPVDVLMASSSSVYPARLASSRGACARLSSRWISRSAAACSRVAAFSSRRVVRIASTRSWSVARRAAAAARRRATAVTAIARIANAASADRTATASSHVGNAGAMAGHHAGYTVAIGRRAPSLDPTDVGSGGGSVAASPGARAARPQAERRASIVAVATTPSTRRASSGSDVTNASAWSWVRATYSAS